MCPCSHPGCIFVHDAVVVIRNHLAEMCFVDGELFSKALVLCRAYQSMRSFKSSCKLVLKRQNRSSKREICCEWQKKQAAI